MSQDQHAGKDVVSSIRTAPDVSSRAGNACRKAAENSLLSLGGPPVLRLVCGFADAPGPGMFCSGSRRKRSPQTDLAMVDDAFPVHRCLAPALPRGEPRPCTKGAELSSSLFLIPFSIQGRRCLSMRPVEMASFSPPPIRLRAAAVTAGVRAGFYESHRVHPDYAAQGVAMQRRRLPGSSRMEAEGDSAAGAGTGGSACRNRPSGPPRRPCRLLGRKTVRESPVPLDRGQVGATGFLQDAERPLRPSPKRRMEMPKSRPEHPCRPESGSAALALTGVFRKLRLPGACYLRPDGGPCGLAGAA